VQAAIQTGRNTENNAAGLARPETTAQTYSGPVSAVSTSVPQTT
jgi:hypothetical protein